jgi:hypothetical protein
MPNVSLLPLICDEHLYVATMEKHAGMIAAAAIKAVADQVVPEFWHDDNDIYGETMQNVRSQLLAIAAELEGAQ